MAIIPRAIPEREVLQRCKIISHRGEHDNKHVMENTLAAFAIARDAGVWGIECDIRWTADLVPVICHDPSPQRVFGIDRPVSDWNFSDLRQAVPDIPSLEEVVGEFGGNTHLMLELKSEPWPQQAVQEETLRRLLASLTPTEHYHFLGLDPELFERVNFVAGDCFYPVAETNVRPLSDISLAQGYGGLGGHYLLLGNRLKARHEASGQRIGTGFPRSRNCLFRELNRGIEWIFTNDAVALQKVRDEHLARWQNQ